jgi:hypothetical protein
MKRYIIGLVAGVFLAAIPIAVQAQERDDEGLILRIDGDVIVESSETVGAVVVINGNATIEGTVTDSVLIIDGTATVSGTIEGDIVVISGDLVLENGSTVNDVNLIRSDLTRASGANVTGDITERENLFFRGAWAVFSLLIWAAATFGLILGALLFAAIGGRQLSGAANALTSEVPGSVLAAVVIWIGVPILAGLIMLTLIGIPFGIVVLVAVLPALFVLGYIVAGTRLGMVFTGWVSREPGAHPYLAAFLGVLVFQLLLLVPFVGWLVATLAGFYGAGGLGLVAWRAFRGEPNREAPAPAEATPAA